MTTLSKTLIHTDSNDHDDVDFMEPNFRGASKRRYVIKQEKNDTGSTSTGVLGTQPPEGSVKEPPQTLQLAEVHASRAPLASFGEDDSPRS